MRDFFDLHTHTIACNHAYSTLSENIKAAAEKGFQVMGYSEHGYGMSGTTDILYFLNFRAIPDVIHGVRLLKGIEANVFEYDGTILEESILWRMDYVIASLHTNCLEPGTKEQNTKAVIGAIKNPWVDVIGHPDDSRYPMDYRAIVKAAKEYHKVLEVNDSSLEPDSFRQNARENYIEILKLCQEYKVPILLSSDAHFFDRVGVHDRAWALSEELGFPEEQILNTDISNLNFIMERRKKVKKEQKK